MNETHSSPAANQGETGCTCGPPSSRSVAWYTIRPSIRWPSEVGEIWLGVRELSPGRHYRRSLPTYINLDAAVNQPRAKP